MPNRFEFYPRGLPVPRVLRPVMLLAHMVGWIVVINSVVMAYVHLAIKVLV